MSSSTSSTLPPGVVAPSPTESSTLPPGVAPSPSPVIPPAGIASSDSANPLSSNALSSTSTPNQSSLSSTITPLPLVVSTNPPSSSSSSPQTSATSVSTTTSQKSASSSSAHTSPTNSSNSSPHQLANGAVAGIVIAVALGLSLLTFLATYFLMRRRQQSKSKGRRRDRSSRDSGELEMKPPRQRSKKPFVTEASGVSDTYENYLPQSADDRTIHQKTKAVLDQIELHVENFYRNSSSSAPRPDNAELAVFESPYLPASLASLLPRSKKKTNIIKHALAQSVTSSISPSASPARSLLPTEYGLLPNTVASAMSTVSTKAGSSQIMSRWRVMTAYLRPDPTKDATYITQRDRQINGTVQSFAKAFAPWKSTGYKDEERARSLSAILEDAANLGIFLFSQPSILKFHWPASSEVGSGRIVVSPALLKVTDERGQDLVEAQIMVDAEVLDA